jgi:hypothetical protein
MRNRDKKQTLSPVRVIQTSENTLPISKEKFHNELQISIHNGKINLIRMIKAAPNNLWTAASPQKIKVVFHKYVDVCVPFDEISINNGETLEFLFANAHYGIKEYFVPNEMLLTIKRQ